MNDRIDDQISDILGNLSELSSDLTFEINCKDPVWRVVDTCDQITSECRRLDVISTLKGALKSDE